MQTPYNDALELASKGGRSQNDLEAFCRFCVKVTQDMFDSSTKYRLTEKANASLSQAKYYAKFPIEPIMILNVVRHCHNVDTILNGNCKISEDKFYEWLRLN